MIPVMIKFGMAEAVSAPLIVIGASVAPGAIGYFPM